MKKKKREEGGEGGPLNCELNYLKGEGEKKEGPSPVIVEEKGGGKEKEGRGA